MPRPLKWLFKATKSPVVAVRRLSSQSVKQNESVRKYYTPVSTKTVFLAGVLIFVLGCIGAIEAAFRLGSVVDLVAAQAKVKPTSAHLVVRQTSAATTAAIAYVTPTKPSTTTEAAITSVAYIAAENPEDVASSTTQPPTATTVKEAYVASETSESTPTPCYVTQTVVEYYAEDGTSPVSVDAGDTPQGSGSSCITKTMTVTSQSYVKIATPTDDPTGDDNGDDDGGDASDCTVTATATTEVTAYRTVGVADGQSTQTSTVVVAGEDAQGDIVGLLPEETDDGGCVAVTVTRTKTKYIDIRTPAPVAPAAPANPDTTRSSATIRGGYITPTVGVDAPDSNPLGTPGPAPPTSDYTYLTVSATTDGGGYLTVAAPHVTGSDEGGGVGAAPSDDYAMIKPPSVVTLADGAVTVVDGDNPGAQIIQAEQTPADINGLIPVSTIVQGSESFIVYAQPQRTADASGLVQVATVTLGSESTPNTNGLVPVSTVIQGSEALIIYARPKPTSNADGRIPVSTIVQGSKSYVVYATSMPTDGAQYVTVVALPADQTTTTSGKATSTSKPDVLPSVSSSDRQLSDTFDDWDYFYASYLSVFIAVFIKEVWAVVFCNTKMMEPFYQLHRPDGASAEESLLANYLSTWLSWKSFRSMFKGQWVLMFVIIIYAFMAALSPIATATMKVQATDWCNLPDGNHQPCSPMWLIDQSYGRALQALLSVIAVMILILIVVNHRRKSGVFSNPSSIASLAALLTHPETLEELRALDPNATDTTITHCLSGQRFRLDYHQTPAGAHHYGILKDDSPLLSPSTKYGTIANPYNRHAPTTSSARAHHTKRMLRDALFLLWICAMLGLVLGYFLASADDAFNRFFNRGDAGPRLLLTTLAVLTSLHWKTLEREVRVLTPYRRLSARRASPQVTVLVNLNGTPVTSLPGALARGEWFYALVAFVAILSDALIIMIAGVPFNRSQVYKAFLASVYSSMAILGTMIVTLVSLFFWRVTNEKMQMPREPDTLAGVALMLCNEGNGVRAEMEGMECLGGKERNRAVKEGRNLYYAGWTRSSLAEESRWVVEKEVDGRVVERHW
ncbi:uncharacterized protein HMPREF1541_06133 [Cyphellophora europaea CBS 101466]|uniref:Uncharacterized protein n=1 Tax=Cyphellophora europaea (strain CBS 101466) TaxID=1220924 RepID=W2RU13_CYPE1|nr:uncharacterized protein HMPREF1541_06133 [Cyphellophora europaea CBS 101466]ETN39907.1 hypothetical protein HMPREF1541_06133 [Cyphellophora europaea CBS 101466]